MLREPFAGRLPILPRIRISGAQGENPGTRELIIAGTPFLVPYQVQGDRLTILAVLHGAQRRPEFPD
jgi:plasmid stabilization system protein ParE